LCRFALQLHTTNLRASNSYPDTQRYRLGTNYNQLPVNAPLNAPINFQRGGAGLFVSQGDRPNYESTIKPYKFAGPKYDTSKHEKYLEGAMLDLSAITEKDFEQPRQLYEKVYDADAKARFVSNVAGHLADVKSEVIKNRALALL
jgi:catalase